ncbi:hypothetical protein cypCar_00022025 [Cyprinus carpio]|nr:hypothetical protein cypCar_00022025 [Cyprinus carpio]
MVFCEFTSTAAQLYDKWIKDADPRTKDWLLMSSPLPQTLIIVFYIYFVMSLGPRLMENRKPFDLKRVLVIYNFSVVAYSLYMCYEFVMSGWGTGYSFGCELVDYSRSPKAMRMAWTCWLYYFSKFIEMLDTIQFVIITCHISQYFFMKDCPYQYPIFIYIIALYGIIFLFLFLNFWYHAYTKGKRLPKVLQNSTMQQNNNDIHHKKD